MHRKELTEKLNQLFEHFRSELATVRTSRANAALIEDIKVEAYEGTPPLMIRELATINTPEPNLLVVSPWDLSLIPKIETALRKSPSLGFNPIVFDNLIRVPMPMLTEERRIELSKFVRVKLEEVRETARVIRQDAMRALDEMEENGILSEDDRFRGRAEVEIEIKEINARLAKVSEEKEAEILRI